MVVRNIASVHIDSIEAPGGIVVTLPTSSGELTTKEYVDGSILDVKEYADTGIAAIHVPDVTVGPVTTGDPGSDASATMDTAENGDKILNITLPRGETGNIYKVYATIAAANADLASIPADNLIAIDDDGNNTGFWTKRGGVLVQWSGDRVALLEQKAASLELSGPHYDNVPLIVDADGKVAVSISATTGKVTMSRDPATVLADMEPLGIVPEFDTCPEQQTQYAYALADEDGRVVLSVDKSGLVTIYGGPGVAQLAAVAAQSADNALRKIDRREKGLVQDLAGSSLAACTAEINHILISGQSLSIGGHGVPVLTFDQPFDNIMFNGGVVVDLHHGVFADQIATFAPLVEGDPDDVPGNEQETVGSSMANMVSSLVLDEALPGQTQVQDILVSCNGENGSAISGLVKGTAAYTSAMSQISRALLLSAAADKSYAFQAVAWIQGESDVTGYNNTVAGYKAALIQLKRDFVTDSKAITGQAHDPAFITYQTASHTRGMGGGDPGQFRAAPTAGIAQYFAMRDEPGLYMACPMYFFSQYDDGTHMSSLGYRHLGSYIAKVYKRVVVDRLGWKPLMPLAVRRQGRIVLADFHVPVPPVVLDTTAVTDPGDYGFELVDDTGAVAIASVSIIGPQQVKIVAGRDFGANPRLRYAYTGIVGANAGPTTGPRGCLRDSDTTESFYPSPTREPWILPNWCVMFEEIIG